MLEERREQVTRVAIEQSQRATGGTRRSRWKAAAFNGWHEPDKSRGLRPESVSGSGCNSPGRLGLGVKLPGPTRPKVGQGRACTMEAKAFSFTHRTNVFADGTVGKNK